MTSSPGKTRNFSFAMRLFLLSVSVLLKPVAARTPLFARIFLPTWVRSRNCRLSSAQKCCSWRVVATILLVSSIFRLLIGYWGQRFSQLLSRVSWLHYLRHWRERRRQDSAKGGTWYHPIWSFDCQQGSLSMPWGKLPLTYSIFLSLTRLFIWQIDLAPHVGASLEVMRRDAAAMRGTGPTLFTSVRNNDGVDAVMDIIVSAWRASQGNGKARA